MLGIDHTSYRAGVAHCRQHGGPWQRGVAVACKRQCYGPFASMAVWKTRIFNIERAGLAAWGMTNSFEITYHIQSYFRAEKDIFQAPAFRTFMDKPWHTMDYQGVVKHGSQPCSWSCCTRTEPPPCAALYRQTRKTPRGSTGRTCCGAPW